MAGPSSSSSPPALVASVAFGSVGLVLLLIGLVSGSQIVVVCGVAAATISLVAALVWREQLIEAWQSRKAPPPD
ncbi:MAG TPA: hypothetical protein VHS52_10775 [Acidimicrobiales bacterium]|nr:hypothetical protein [Acidimicrobiales bacterium]